MKARMEWLQRMRTGLPRGGGADALASELVRLVMVWMLVTIVPALLGPAYPPELLWPLYFTALGSMMILIPFIPVAVERFGVAGPWRGLLACVAMVVGIRFLEARGGLDIVSLSLLRVALLIGFILAITMLFCILAGVLIVAAEKDLEELESQRPRPPHNQESSRAAV